MTTVGYGDITPKGSVPGEIVGLAVMLVGIGFLSILTATFASHFVKVDGTPEGRTGIKDEALALQLESAVAEISEAMSSQGRPE